MDNLVEEFNDGNNMCAAVEFLHFLFKNLKCDLKKETFTSFMEGFLTDVEGDAEGFFKDMMNNTDHGSKKWEMAFNDDRRHGQSHL